MGTSSIFHGRNDRNPLLPDDFEENPDEFEPTTWKSVKTDMSKFITQGGGNVGSAKRIVSKYVRASGGSKGMIARSNSGISTAKRIGGFFSGISSVGYRETLRSLGIDVDGRSIHEVFSRLVDILSPESNTKEECAARKATQDALAEIYEYLEQNGLDFALLDSLPAEMMNTVLCSFISNYIWMLMMQDLESRFEKYDVNPTAAIEKEQTFKSVIHAVVDVECKHAGDIIRQDINSVIPDIYEKCYKVLEALR